ncbi:MAG: tRNA lysidine(34) synthetase TilS [Sphingomonadales bacterium]
MENGPLSHVEFSKLMDDVGLSPLEPYCVAVSGGADSMALALLVHNWGEKSHFITFDHGLRKNSREEALNVNSWLKDRGLKHHILNWDGEKPKSDIQASARQARYKALEGYCIKNSLPKLLLGHHLDDQAETFFIRLLRGSGVKGLSAMEKKSSPNSIRLGPEIIRPLLEVPKERLRATLQEMGQCWVDDPSNENIDFLRIQVRKLLEATEIEGLNRNRLAGTAHRMQRANSAFEFLTNDFILSYVSVSNEGVFHFSQKSFMALQEEIGLRVLSSLFIKIGGGIYPQRLKKIERVYSGCLKADFKGLTLAGCKVFKKEDCIFIKPEFPREI